MTHTMVCPPLSFIRDVHFVLHKSYDEMRVSQKCIIHCPDDIIKHTENLFAVHITFNPGFPKLVSPKAKVGKTLFGPIQSTNPSVRMA